MNLMGMLHVYVTHHKTLESFKQVKQSKSVSERQTKISYIGKKEVTVVRFIEGLEK